MFRVFKQPTDVSPLSLAEQKLLMRSGKPLLTPEQTTAAWTLAQKELAAQGTESVFIKKSANFPFNIIRTADKTYVLSDILLGEGGEGVVSAAQAISSTGQAEWVAVKEGLADKAMYDLYKSFLHSDLDEFMAENAFPLLVIYSAEHPDVNLDEISPTHTALLDSFHQHIEKIKSHTWQNAERNAFFLEDLQGIKPHVFACNQLVYFAMPLIRGNDLLMLAGNDAKKDYAEIVNAVKQSVAEDKQNACLRWGEFLLSHLKLITQVVHQIHDIHQKNCLHRDIKPENIMLTELAKIALIDFGTVVRMHENSYVGPSNAGTLHYLSPQLAQHRSERPDKNYIFTKADDLYSLGVTLRELNCQALASSIEALYPVLYAQFKEIFTAMNRLVDADPLQRINAMEVLLKQMNQLTQAIEIECGLVLQHDDKPTQLVARVDYYRYLLHHASAAASCTVNFTIDEIALPPDFAQALLSSQLEDQEIAKNLLLIKRVFLDLQAPASAAAAFPQSGLQFFSVPTDEKATRQVVIATASSAAASSPVASQPERGSPSPLPAVELFVSRVERLIRPANDAVYPAKMDSVAQTVEASEGEKTKKLR